MALPSSLPRVPTTIIGVTITLNSLLIPDELTGEYTTETKKAAFLLTILDQDGTHMRPYGGDLLPHLTQDQIDWLIPFMNEMRAAAEATLPTT